MPRNRGVPDDRLTEYHRNAIAAELDLPSPAAHQLDGLDLVAICALICDTDDERQRKESS